MLKPDHLMIETPSPLEAANQLSEQFGLPSAWPLIETPAYRSTGVNFGDINIEFIDFKVRFGIENTSFSGFSGVAFKTDEDEAAALERLQALGFSCRVGERAEGHTTITVEEEAVFPTLFLVKYHFDLSGWQARLKQTFAECRGGKYRISRFHSLALAQPLPEGLTNVLAVQEAGSGKHRLTFTTDGDLAEPVVLPDVIEHLEIVLI